MRLATRNGRRAKTDVISETIDSRTAVSMAVQVEKAHSDHAAD
jgi:hypothetical protein